MKGLTRKSWLWMVVGILFIVLTLRVFFFCTEKPKATVDYLAQFNEYTRPENVDPLENAAPYYQKAFDAFVEWPEELHRLQRRFSALSDYAGRDDVDTEKLSNLKEWLTSNTTAFELFEEAVNKPYCWIERSSDNASVYRINTPQSQIQLDFVEALIWKAHFYAKEGQLQDAFDTLLICYDAGVHKCRPNLLISEQYLGLRIKRMAVEESFLMIANNQIEGHALERFQKNLQARLNTDSYVPSLYSGKLTAYDIAQRAFLNRYKGKGRWAWSNGWPTCMCGDTSLLTDLKVRLQYCLLGPTKKDIENQIEWALTQSDRILHKTPWQVKNEEAAFFTEINKIKNSHIFFAIVTVPLDPENILNAYHQTNTQTEALITVLAVLRYQKDTGHLPQSLGQLVAADYLQSVPNDPYSDKSLMYVPTGDNFKLYSVGKDFTDNGGIMAEDQVHRRKISLAVKSPDIIYWPITMIEPKPREDGMGTRGMFDDLMF